MAGDYARMKRSRWEDDPDWLNLDQACQNTYDMILQDKRISWCGVMTYAPAVLATKSVGNTESKVRRTVATLESRGFLATDSSTNEILVRSYVRHDGVMDRRNLGKAVARALDKVMSIQLRGLIRVELRRLLDESPGAAGWMGFKDESPEEYAVVSAMPYGIQSRIESGIQP